MPQLLKASVVSLLLALPAFLAGQGAVAEERTILPGVASTTGAAGARFVSTVWLANPSDSPLALQIGLVTPSGSAGSLVPLNLGPRETRRIDDPVASLFGLAQTAGTVTIRSDRPVAVRGTTANVADPKGTYGLALVASRESDALRPGETGIAPWLTHTAAAGIGFRTNVAVTLLEGGGRVRVTVVDDTGLVRGESVVTGDAPLFWQRAVTELAADPEIPLGRVEVEVLEGSAFVYAAVVDNVTGDGILVRARRDLPAGPPHVLLVDGAARAPGANGTSWRTGLRLVNPGLAPVTATLQTVGLPAASAVRVVPPRGAVEEGDLLGALGQTEGSAGAVRVTSSLPLVGLAATRNSDPAGTPGTFAAAQEPTDAAEPFGAGRVLLFPGLSADSGATGFRTNVAFLGGSAGARASLLLRSASGATLGQASVDLAPAAWTQRSLPDWFGGLSVPRDATLEVTVTSGSLDSYASVIDNGTGDPVILRPIPVASAACPPSAAAPVLTASLTSVAAGGTVILSLSAPGRGAGRVVPGDLPLSPGGSSRVVPAVTTTYRWLPPAGCAEDSSAPVTVTVTPPGGTVMTEGGALRGVTAGGATSFKGIPFAAPPTGPLRFRPPAPAAAWSGVRDAAAFGPICSQLNDAGAATGAEACLFLNVWTPAQAPVSPLPVLFFIHGGGNAAGAASTPYYDGTTWASKGRAVVVTVDYRLSSFGWLAQPSLAAESRRGVSGNYGLLDLLAALRWTGRNIAAFGGDPKRVTIFGESAGGVNVCSLVASPLARGLFSGALGESGGCGQRPLSDYVTFGNTVAEKAGCSGAPDPAACLRGLSAEQILLAVPPEISITSFNGQLWGPAVDGFVLPDSPDAALAKGSQNKVPFAIGANADETGAAAPAIATEAEYRATVTAQFGGLAPLVLSRYPASAYPTPRKAFVAVTTDARFVCPSRRFARAAATGGSPKVFRYFFSYPANRLYGAIHGAELPFVFGSLASVPGYVPDAAAKALSEAMNASWARFAATGDPNGSGLPAWPAYDPVRDSTLDWDTPAIAVDGIRTSSCDFWDSLMALAAP